MRIATLTAEGRGETDRLLAELAEKLIAEGVNAAGIVKHMAHESQFDNGCDMHVRVLPDGPIIPITQALGAGSDACRLDPAGIAASVAAVEGGDLVGADLMILNKFGPEEAEGRGFRTAIATALEAGVPVLVGLGLGAQTRAAFDAFTAGMAEALPADPAALEAWCRAPKGADTAA